MRLFHGGLTLLAVGLVVGAVYFYAGQSDNPGLVYQESLRMLKHEVLANPPVGYNSEGIQYLFRGTLRRIGADSLIKVEVRDLNAQIIGILKDNRLDSLEIKGLLQTLERINKGNQ
jgi:hypothetical protein